MEDVPFPWKAPPPIYKNFNQATPPRTFEREEEIRKLVALLKTKKTLH
jgi:hypothetical protein